MRAERRTDRSAGPECGPGYRQALIWKPWISNGSGFLFLGAALWHPCHCSITKSICVKTRLLCAGPNANQGIVRFINNEIPAGNGWSFLFCRFCKLLYRISLWSRTTASTDTCIIFQPRSCLKWCPLRINCRNANIPETPAHKVKIFWNWRHDISCSWIF